MTEEMRIACPECGQSKWRDLAYDVGPKMDESVWNGNEKGKHFTCLNCFAIVDNIGNLIQSSCPPDEGWYKGNRPQLIKRREMK